MAQNGQRTTVEPSVDGRIADDYIEVSHLSSSRSSPASKKSDGHRRNDGPSQSIDEKRMFVDYENPGLTLHVTVHGGHLSG